MRGIEERLLVRLKRKGRPGPLPDFAKWSIRLGRVLYESHSCGERRFVTLAVPTRAYVSAFIALGALEAALASADVATLGVEVGATVRVWNQDGNYQVGTFGGREARTVLGETKEYYTIHLRGQRVLHVPVGLARVEPVELDQKSGTKFDGVAPPDWFSLVDQCYLLDDLTARLSAISDVVAIVGSRAQLERETDGLMLHVEEGSDPIALSTLIFTRKRPPFEREVQLVPAASKQSESLKAQILVLDGDRAVSGFDADAHDGSVVALLTPASPGFNMAVSGLQARLQFARPDHDWAELAGQHAPALEWTCHRL
jgi:hypothetical protein